MKNNNIVPLPLSKMGYWVKEIDEIVKYKRPFYSMAHVLAIPIRKFDEIQNKVITICEKGVSYGILPKKDIEIIYSTIVTMALFVDPEEQPICLRCGMDGRSLIQFSKYGFIPCHPKTTKNIESSAINKFIFGGCIKELNEICAKGIRLFSMLNACLNIHQRFQQHDSKRKSVDKFVKID